MVTTGEEFGIAAVEAQAAGRPVIARAAGGLLENVVDGVTGCSGRAGRTSWPRPSARFDTLAVDSDACIANARRFDSAVFRETFPREVEAAHQRGPVAPPGDLAAHSAPPDAEPAPGLAREPLRRLGQDSAGIPPKPSSLPSASR